MYFDADGKRVTDRDEIDRLNAIGLPPAYERAWLCPHSNGHIQATGYDAKGRKQYRYHLNFRARQDAAKYDGCSKFGRKLPKLRKRVEADLARRTVTKDTVAAAVVRLLDQEYLRASTASSAS
jgi:DNA topoisomerase-1